MRVSQGGRKARQFGSLPVGLLGALAATCLAGPARADQLIQIPTADRPLAPRGEYLHRFSGDGEGYGTLLVPAGQSYELMFRYYNGLDGSHNLEGGGQFQLLPDGIVTPGIALGMWDVTNSGPWGRRAFFVLTKSLEQGQLGLPRPFQRAQLTLGAGTGRIGPVFGGLRLELPAHFSLIAEYDARRLNTGLEFRPIKPISLKAQLQNGNFYFGGDLSLRF